MNHFLIIASYAVVAALAGHLLSQAMPELPAYVGYLVAVAGFLAAALVHEALARRQEARGFEGELDQAFEEIDTLRELNRDLMQDMGRAREEMALLCEVVEQAAEGANQMMVREMKVLQQQLGQLTNLAADRSASGGRRSRGGEPDSAAEAKREEAARLEVIRDALNANRVDLYLQPVVSLPQRRTRYYEAMSRLRTREDAMLMPDDYIGLAIEAGLIATIDNLLLLRCVQLLRRVQNRRPAVGFFVNISPHTLTDATFMSQFVDFLESNRELAGRIIFEFAQRDIDEIGRDVGLQLDRLARLGFRFSMDQVERLDLDAGMLARRHFRFVKVPAHLLLSDPEEAGARVDPQDLKELLYRADIQLVVDKIEEERQVVEILEYDPPLGQGFLFGEPRPGREDAEAAA